MLKYYSNSIQHKKTLNKDHVNKRKEDYYKKYDVDFFSVLLSFIERTYEAGINNYFDNWSQVVAPGIGVVPQRPIFKIGKLINYGERQKWEEYLKTAIKFFVGVQTNKKREKLKIKIYIIKHKIILRQMLN